MLNAPIFWLTVRQFIAGKALWIAGFFAAAPVLLILIDTIFSSDATQIRIMSVTFFEVALPTVIPLGTLVLATGAFGNEIADRTLPYLMLKPIGRLRISIEKTLASLALVSAIFVGGITLGWIVSGIGTSEWDIRTLFAVILATIAAVVGYGTVFTTLSLLVSRTLLVGILYILLWETLLARLITGLHVLSIRHYAQSLYVQINEGSDINLANAASSLNAILIIVLIGMASIGISTLMLRRQNLD